MSARFAQYNPQRVLLTWRGIPFTMFMDGTFITAERAEDGYSMSVGATGDVTRVRSLNRTGSVTCVLQAASPTNDMLSQAALLDEALDTGFGPLLLKDLNSGGTLIQSSVAWVRKLPSVEFATEGSGREWVLDCHELLMNVSGALALL